eukprot:9095735-Karenia_brevis.AAC.1
MDASHSDAGMDNLSPADFKLLSEAVFNKLAQLLQMIEDGAEWPEALLHGKAVLGLKDPEDRFNPLAYRILLILPNLYRKWAATRLTQLEPWIRRWQLPTMHAGVPGSGAEDAWYMTGVHIEHSRVHNKHVIGGTLDIYKCFDQIVRPLLYFQLRMGGFPRKLLNAYIAYHEHVELHFVFASHIGEGHTHECGIPQG